VQVGVEGDGDSRVSRTPLHDLGAHDLTQKQRGAGAPWVASDALSESGSSANARQTNAVSLHSPQ